MKKAEAEIKRLQEQLAKAIGTKRTSETQQPITQGQCDQCETRDQLVFEFENLLQTQQNEIGHLRQQIGLTVFLLKKQTLEKIVQPLQNVRNTQFLTEIQNEIGALNQQQLTALLPGMNGVQLPNHASSEQLTEELTKTVKVVGKIQSEVLSSASIVRAVQIFNSNSTDEPITTFCELRNRLGLSENAAASKAALQIHELLPPPSSNNTQLVQTPERRSKSKNRATWANKPKHPTDQEPQNPLEASFKRNGGLENLLHKK